MKLNKITDEKRSQVQSKLLTERRNSLNPKALVALKEKKEELKELQTPTTPRVTSVRSSKFLRRKSESVFKTVESDQTPSSQLKNNEEMRVNIQI